MLLGLMPCHLSLEGNTEGSSLVVTSHNRNKPMDKNERGSQKTLTEIAALGRPSGHACPCRPRAVPARVHYRRQLRFSERSGVDPAPLAGGRVNGPQAQGRLFVCYGTSLAITTDDRTISWPRPLG